MRIPVYRGRQITHRNTATARRWPVLALCCVLLPVAHSTGQAQGSPYASAVLADSPIGYWRLGDGAGATNAADSSSQNRPLISGGSVAPGVSGALANDANAAAGFDAGPASYLYSANPLTLGADFTIEAWVRSSNANAHGTVVSLVSGDRTRTLYLEGRRFLGGTDISANWPAYAVFGPTLDPMLWHHVVFSVEGGTTLRLYVDGAQVASRTVATRAGFSARPVLGWSEASWVPRFGGALDEVAVYASALPAARVRAHYDAGRAQGAVTSGNCGASLQSLIDQAAPGATVSVPACTYRETVRITKSLTLAGQNGAEIRGSDVWTGWNSNGGTWVSQQSVPALPVVSLDPGACEPGDSTSRCLRPEQVFINGQALTLLPPGSTPGPGQFALVGSGDRRVRLGQNPNGQSIEVSVRPRWVITQAHGVTIQGLTMRHAANGATVGAVDNNGYSNWTLQDNLLSDAHANNVRLADGNNLRVLRNDIARGGLSGISGGNVRQGGVVQGNRIRDNGFAGFNKDWGAGGLKLTEIDGFLIDGNEASGNVGQGIWCDIACSNVTISRNRVHHNTWEGILFEISDRARIFENAAWENGWGKQAWGWGAGITVSSAANTEVYGNVVAWNYSGISVISQDRDDALPQGPVDNYVHDNVIVKKTVNGDFSQTYWRNLSLAWLADWASPIYQPWANNRGWNNRVWYDYPEDETVRFVWDDTHFTLGEFLPTPGGSATSYLGTTEMYQILRDWGIPLTPER